MLGFLKGGGLYKMGTLVIVFALMGVMALILMGASISWFGFHNLFMKNRGSSVGRVIWEDKGPTPLGEKGYTPQGMTWVNGVMIFANTWKNKRSRVYEIDPKTMKIMRHFDMPNEAVHTSGLAWDGRSFGVWIISAIKLTALILSPL